MTDFLHVTMPVGPTHSLLGQIRVIDSRSVNFFHWPWEPDESIPTFRPKAWQPNVPILDQSNLISQGVHTGEFIKGVADVDSLGSCTAHATMYAASVICGVDHIKKAHFDLSTPAKIEETCIKWYSRFTGRDQFLRENWPLDDCGSSGLGASKTLQKDYGLIGKYEWAKNAEGVCSMLQKGPIIVGMPWYNAFFDPDKYGFIDHDSTWDQSGVAGGHEVAWCALEKVVQKHDGTIDTAKSIIAFPNSWNRGWGDAGWGRMHLSTYQKLRSQIDVIQFKAA